MKSYRQYCGVARALDVVGERWTLLIVRDLLPGPRRYSELLAGLPGITTNLLAKRLVQLAEAGVVESQPLAGLGDVTGYALTPLGRELEPAVLALGRFGAHWMDELRPDDEMRPRWAMVSLQRRYRARGPSSGLPGRVSLVVGKECYQASLDGERLVSRDARSAPGESDAQIAGDMPAWGALLRGASSVRELEKRGGLAVTGRRVTVQAFVRGIGAHY